MTALKLLNNETERQIAVGRKMSARNSTDIVSQTINNERTTVIVGDSITKNVQGIKLAKTVGHRVVVKPFPGATIRDMPGASNVNFRKISVQKTIWELNFRNICCFPASPKVFEHLKNDIIAHF